MSSSVTAGTFKRTSLVLSGLLITLCPAVSRSADSQPAPLSAAKPTSAPPAVWSVAFSPDGKTLAAGSYQRVQLWDAEAWTPARNLTGHAGPVRCLAWSGDGKQLAAGGGKPGTLGEVKIWTVGDGTTAAAPMTLAEHKDVVEGVAFNTTGGVLVTASVDEKALPVELATRKVVRPMTDHTNRIITVAFSPNGKYVATGSLDRTIKIWNAQDFTPLANTDHAGGQVHNLVFLSDGNQFFAGGEDGNMRLYRISESRSGKVTGYNISLGRTIGGNRTPIFAVAASQKGNLMAAAGEDSLVHVFDTGGGRKHTLKDCTGPVYSLSFNPDGSLLAAASRDGKVRVWTTKDGKLATELTLP